MNFVADESVDQPIVSRLRRDGHTVWAVAEMTPGITDSEVLTLANQQRAVLLTGDKDFGELVFRDHRYTFGIILIRLSGLTADAKAELVATAIREHIAELAHAFTVIRPNRVRIRPRFLL